MLFLCGTVAAFSGASTCHVNVRSAANAPQLCATAGNNVALSISAVLGPGLVALALLFSAGRRTLGYLSGVCLAGEAVLFVMWSLVAHGSIRY